MGNKLLILVVTFVFPISLNSNNSQQVKQPKKPLADVIFLTAVTEIELLPSQLETLSEKLEALKTITHE